MLAGKGSRRIVVNGAAYRWRIRHKPTYNQANGWSPLTFAVEGASTPGTLLIVRTSHHHPSNWLGLPSKAVRPADVEYAIRTARSRGWTPQASGSPFILELSDVEEPSA